MWSVIKSVLAALIGVQNDRQRQHDFFEWQACCVHFHGDRRHVVVRSGASEHSNVCRGGESLRNITLAVRDECHLFSILTRHHFILT